MLWTSKVAFMRGILSFSEVFVKVCVAWRAGCADVLAAVYSEFLAVTQLRAQPRCAPRRSPRPCVPRGHVSYRPSLRRPLNLWSPIKTSASYSGTRIGYLEQVFLVQTPDLWEQWRYIVCVVHICYLCGMSALLSSLNTGWYFCPLNSDVVLPARVNSAVKGGELWGLQKGSARPWQRGQTAGLPSASSEGRAVRTPALLLLPAEPSRAAEADGEASPLPASALGFLQFALLMLPLRALEGCRTSGVFPEAWIGSAVLSNSEQMLMGSVKRI